MKLVTNIKLNQEIPHDTPFDQRERVKQEYLSMMSAHACESIGKQIIDNNCCDKGLEIKGKDEIHSFTYFVFSTSQLEQYTKQIIDSITEEKNE